MELHLYSNGDDPYRVKLGEMQLVIHFSAAPPDRDPTTAPIEAVLPKSPKDKPDEGGEEILNPGGISGGVVGLQPVTMPHGTTWVEINDWAAPRSVVELDALLSAVTLGEGAQLAMELPERDRDGTDVGRIVDGMRGITADDVTFHVTTPMPTDG